MYSQQGMDQNIAGNMHSQEGTSLAWNMKIREHAEQESKHCKEQSLQGTIFAGNKHCSKQTLQGPIIAGNKCTREKPRQRESVQYIQFNKCHREQTWQELNKKKGKNRRGEFNNAGNNRTGTLYTLQVRKRVMGCPHWVLFEV
jgi:hypothetical protein